MRGSLSACIYHDAELMTDVDALILSRPYALRHSQL